MHITSEMDHSFVQRSQYNIQRRSTEFEQLRSTNFRPFLYGIIFLVFTKSQLGNSHVIRVNQEQAYQTCAVNDSVTLDCGASPSDSVTWYYSPTAFPGQMIQLSNRTTWNFVGSEPFNYSIVGCRDLYIEAAKEYHSGRYTCQRSSPGGRWVQPINRTTELRVIPDDDTLVRPERISWNREKDLVKCLAVLVCISLFLILFYKITIARKFRRENTEQENEKSTSGLTAKESDEPQYAND